MRPLYESLRGALTRFRDTGRLPADAIQALADVDPTPTKKYVEWLCGRYEEFQIEVSKRGVGGPEGVSPTRADLWGWHPEDGTSLDPADGIGSVLRRYDEYSRRGLIPAQYRDIYSINDEAELEEIVEIEVEEAMRQDTRRRATASVRAHSKIVGRWTFSVASTAGMDDVEAIVVAPKNHQEAMAWGAGTRWCISVEGDTGEVHWSDYTSTDSAAIYFVILESSSPGAIDRIFPSPELRKVAIRFHRARGWHPGLDTEVWWAVNMYTADDHQYMARYFKAEYKTYWGLIMVKALDLIAQVDARAEFVLQNADQL